MRRNARSGTRRAGPYTAVRYSGARAPHRGVQYSTGIFRNAANAFRQYGPRIINTGLRAWNNRKLPDFGKASKASSSKGHSQGNGRYIRRLRGNKSGRYTGTFKKTTRKSGRSLDRFNRDGVLLVKEVSGEVADPDCAYLMNETVNTRDVIFFSIVAVLRKLVAMAGLRSQGVGDVFIENWVTADGTESSTRFKVQFVAINLQTGFTSSTVHSCLITDTLATVASQFLIDVENYSAGYGLLNNTNATIPYKMQLVQIDAAIGSLEIPRAEIRFDEVDIEVYGKAEMKVQNRTASNSGSEDAENVANNPVQGRIYKFQGVPRAKNSGKVPGALNAGPVLFERISYPTAVAGFGAADFTDTIYKEPPVPSSFWNCKESAKVRLDPGQIKSFYVSATKKMNILKLWKAMRIQFTTSSFTTYSVWPFQLLGLEDVINAGALEEVTLGFEIERTLGCRISTRSKRFMKTYFEQTAAPIP